MEWLNKLSLKQIFKIAGLALLGIILIVIVINLVAAPFRVWRNSASQIAGDSGSFNVAGSYLKGEMAVEESVSSLSPRNVAGTTGSDAEAYEVTDYRARIETRRLEDTCAAVSGLKDRDDVIFESASRYDRGCDYTFKVKIGSAAEILGFINSLDPEELSENTRTIKNRVDDFTNQTQILENKLAAIDETLSKAISAYDEVTTLATQARDAGSLAKIIDSKVNIIERLTQERINISTQLDQIGRLKAEQLDRLEYTYFYLNIWENKYFDGESLKESWRAALREFVQDINSIFQDISVNLIVWIMLVIQYLLYFFILLLAAKYVWQFAKYIWRR